GLARNTADVLNFCANEGLGDLFVPEGGGGDDQGVYRGGSAPDIAQGSGFRGIGPRGVIGENQDYIRNRRILADVLRGARKRAVDVGRSAKRLAEDFRDAGDYGIAIGGERDAKASLAVESHESDAGFAELAHGSLHTSARIQKQHEADGAGVGPEALHGARLAFILNDEIRG